MLLPVDDTTAGGRKGPQREVDAVMTRAHVRGTVTAILRNQRFIVELDEHGEEDAQPRRCPS